MPTTNSIIDLSHHNAAVDLIAIQGDGIFGIFHKATQGLHFIDPLYAERRIAAAAAGLNWGAYHFGTGADGAAQADFFLTTADPEAGDLIALDFELNNQGLSMTLDEARDFVSRIKDVRGTWPGLYGGSYLKEQLAGMADPTLSNCWLWLSQYGPNSILPPGWTSWTLWQYTDGHVGPDPHEVKGVQQCDRNMFQGSSDDLTAFWQ